MSDDEKRREIEGLLERVLRPEIGEKAFATANPSGAAPLTMQDLYDAKDRIEREYVQPCGSPSRPHVVHPSAIHDVAGIRWATCANCFQPVPVRGFDG